MGIVEQNSSASIWEEAYVLWINVGMLQCPYAPTFWHGPSLGHPRIEALYSSQPGVGVSSIVQRRNSHVYEESMGALCKTIIVMQSNDENRKLRAKRWMQGSISSIMRSRQGEGRDLSGQPVIRTSFLSNSNLRNVGTSQ